MDGDFYILPPDTGRAPRAPHPWSLIPLIRDEQQIITHVDFSDGGQVVTGVPRVSKAHGHVFQTFYSPDMGLLSVAFGAFAINCGFAPEKGFFPLHNNVDPKDRIKEGSKLRMAVGPMWKRVQGEVCDQEHRYSDAMLIQVPKTHNQFDNALNYVRERADNPSKYQIVGWFADNCVDFAAKTTRAADIGHPALWRICPWPWAVYAHIKNVATQAKRGKTVRIKGARLTRAVPPEEVKRQYNALRSNAVPEHQLIQLAA